MENTTNINGNNVQVENNNNMPSRHTRARSDVYGGRGSFNLATAMVHTSIEES